MHAHTTVGVLGFTAGSELNSALGLLVVLYLENNEERDNVE